MNIKQLVGRIFAITIISIIVGVIFLHISYIPVRDGKLYLKRASSASTLLREAETGIHHIEADTMEMIAYTQGFAHAQDRMWQMEK